jgi:hypothetical protein
MEQCLSQNFYMFNCVLSKRDEGKASTTPCLFVAHDCDIHNLPELLEVFFNIKFYTFSLLNMKATYL